MRRRRRRRRRNSNAARRSSSAVLARCATTSPGRSPGGRTAPDLTHIASRRTIGAGTLPNTQGHLAGWIADPQQIKPGNRMPPTGLTGEELQAVLAYLESLK